MKKLQILARASLLILTLALHTFADDRYLVRVHPSVIDSVARQHRLKVERRVSTDGVYLVSMPAGGSAASLRANIQVQAVERNTSVKLPEVAAASVKGKRRIPYMRGGAPSVWMAGNPFSAYVNQASNTAIRLQDAQRWFGHGHTGVTVAVIDTGVDETHAVLRGVVLPGKSFVEGYSNASTRQETTPFVDQETTPFVDGIGAVVVVQQETTPFVDQETTPFVDQETTPFVDSRAYGHGTMVAGLIHLVAPNVQILPLRAFKSDGSGSLADVLEALDYAIERRVQVINMSFSAPMPSDLLNNSIDRATRLGIICVASVSNDNSRDSAYPAVVGPVIAVGATTNDGYRAYFSNYGPEIDINAPGVDLWSPYPSNRRSNNRYGNSSGTSFSTAYVSGTVALIKSINWTETPAEADVDLTSGAGRVKSPELKGGQLDVFRTVGKGKN